MLQHCYLLSSLDSNVAKLLSSEDSNVAKLLSSVDNYVAKLLSSEQIAILKNSYFQYQVESSEDKVAITKTLHI